MGWKVEGGGTASLSDDMVPVGVLSCCVWLQAVDGVVEVQEFAFVNEGRP